MFLLIMFFYKEKNTIMGPAGMEANALSPVYCFSPQAQRRMEAETGGETADAGPS